MISKEHTNNLVSSMMSSSETVIDPLKSNIPFDSFSSLQHNNPFQTQKHDETQHINSKMQQIYDIDELDYWEQSHQCIPLELQEDYSKLFANCSLQMKVTMYKILSHLEYNIIYCKFLIKQIFNEFMQYNDKGKYITCIYLL